MRFSETPAEAVSAAAGVKHSKFPLQGYFFFLTVLDKEAPLVLGMVRQLSCLTVTVTN